MPLIRLPLIFSRFAHSEMLNAENLDPRFFVCLFVSVLKNDVFFCCFFFRVTKVICHPDHEIIQKQFHVQYPNFSLYRQTSHWSQESCTFIINLSVMNSNTEGDRSCPHEYVCVRCK